MTRTATQIDRMGTRRSGRAASHPITGRRRLRSLARVGAVLLLLLGPLDAARATPLDLRDARARWIEVRFEVSPPDEPGTLDRRWSAPRRARFEPLTDGGISIRIPATELEAQLRSTGTDPVDGSFSDFLWTLDPRTGHVERAAFTGRIREQIRLGPFRTSAQVDIRVDMNTAVGAGFVPGEGIFGVPTNRFCAPAGDGEGASGCVAVLPIRFDPSRGYVNAVGHVRAANALAEIEAFSPLGEVEFRERADGGTESALSGPSGGEAVCSRWVDRSCAVDGGDT